MAGLNKIIKAGEILFRVGDASTAGMFVVRRGELVVFLEKDGQEIVLARVGVGGLVGEMALFEAKPRSASVRAFIESEVTQITAVDFQKLMAQIPKWFVGLMGALSGRLRQTNERLQKAESDQRVSNLQIGDEPYRNAIRLLHLLDLTWSRDGEKAAKDLLLTRSIAEEFIDKNFHDLLPGFKKLLDILISENIIAQKSNSLAIAHRIFLKQLIEKLEDVTQKKVTVSANITDLMQIMENEVAKTGYDQVTLSLEDLKKLSGKSFSENDLQFFNHVSGPVLCVKTSTPSGVGLKILKNEQPAAFTKILKVILAVKEQQI